MMNEMELFELYKNETNLDCTRLIKHKYCDSQLEEVYTDEYIEWLESKLKNIDVIDNVSYWVEVKPPCS